MVVVASYDIQVDNLYGYGAYFSIAYLTTMSHENAMDILKIQQ